MSNTLNVEYVVIKAPIEWFRTYHKILELLACWGERKVVNPNCKCSGSSNVIMEAYELYQSAVAAYNLDKKTEGAKIIAYIDSLLEGYESADTFIVTIDGVMYEFTENDIIVLDDDSSSSSDGTVHDNTDSTSESESVSTQPNNDDEISDDSSGESFDDASASGDE